MYLILVKKTVQEGEEGYMLNEWEGQASGFIGLSDALSRSFDATVLRAVWVIFAP